MTFILDGQCFVLLISPARIRMVHMRDAFCMASQFIMQMAFTDRLLEYRGSEVCLPRRKRRDDYGENR